MSTLYVNTISPNSGDTISVSGSLFVSGTINLGDANTDSVAFGADISSSIIPDANNVYSLGSLSKRWSQVHSTGVVAAAIAAPELYVDNILGHSGSTHPVMIHTASIGRLTSSLIPTTNRAYDLGLPTSTWNNFYVNNVSSSEISSSKILTTELTSSTIQANSINCSGTVVADSFQSLNAAGGGLGGPSGDQLIQFNDSVEVSGSLAVYQDLRLRKDSSVIKMGNDNDVTITHDGTTGAIIKATPISVHSVGHLTLSGSTAAINASGGDVTISAADDVIISAADDISLTSTSEDGLITLHSAHTAGQSILIDANANAGSILDVDAGILDIDVQGAATVDADSITLTGAVTAATGVQSSAIVRTATDDGSGNGTIAAGTSVVLVDADSDANHIIILPAPVVGNIITIIENGTTGYELRTSAPSTIAINGGTGSSGESAIAGATTYIRCVCVSSTAWIATQFAADGTESKVEAAA